MQTNYDLSSIAVLIVEDNQFMQRLLQNILRMFSVRNVRVASDGADGLMELKSFHPDLILCDLEMEVLDGLEFMSLVRESSDSSNPYVPILVLTAHTEASRVYEARDAGMTEYLAKPISASLLYDRICTIIERPRQFVKTAGFFGPDRRRSKPTALNNKRRRKGDEKEEAGAAPEDNPDAPEVIDVTATETAAADAG